MTKAMLLTAHVLRMLLLPSAGSSLIYSLCGQSVIQNILENLGRTSSYARIDARFSLARCSSLLPSLTILSNITWRANLAAGYTRAIAHGYTTKLPRAF